MRTNYDTLTLKLLDGLDQFDKYTEKPNETAFFAQLVSKPSAVMTTEFNKSFPLSRCDQ